MIGILLITHGSLGESLIQCACHVLDKRPAQTAQLGVSPQDDPLDLRHVAEGLLASVDQGEGVLVLTDIVGATPANVATGLIRPGRVEVIAGVNVPMLLRALTYRNKDMLTLIARSLAGGCDGVVHMRH